MGLHINAHLLHIHFFVLCKKLPKINYTNNNKLYLQFIPSSRVIFILIFFLIDIHDNLLTAFELPQQSGISIRSIQSTKTTLDCLRVTDIKIKWKPRLLPREGLLIAVSSPEDTEQNCLKSIIQLQSVTHGWHIVIYTNALPSLVQQWQNCSIFNYLPKWDY